MDDGLTLCGAIEKYLGESVLRFHMPGHKGKDVLGLKSSFEIDLTELNGLDNLHFPEGCIARSQKLMAEICGARESFFLVNGSSAGIISSVLALSGDGSVVCARNSHVSVFKGLCVSGARPVYVMPEILDCGICGGVDYKKVEEGLIKAGNASAVFIVSPTYEGITSDIRRIADTTHKYGAKLFVDEAHGAHFKFGSLFPETALEQGADIVVQSWHKTLAAFGQGAVLHIGAGEIDLEKLKFYVSVMQTTSPSYAIMASLDACRELLMKRGPAIFAEYEDNLNYLRESLSHLKNIKLVSGEIMGKSAVSDYDAGKITLYINGGGKRLEELLRERGIFIEMATRDYAVLLTSFTDSREDYETLLNAVLDIDTVLVSSDLPEKTFYSIPEIAYTPAETLKMRSVAVRAGGAAGLVSAGFITPYPPGVPIAVPGEVISKATAELCACSNSWEILGVFDGGYLRVLE